MLSNMSSQIGTPEWNDEMYAKHATPYQGIAGAIEKKRLRRILAHITDREGPQTLMEVGCEAGNLLHFMEQRLPGFTLLGLDISQAALAQAKGKLSEQVSLIQNDLTRDAPPEHPPLDYLICSETLEHIPDVAPAIEGLWKLTHPGTTVIITVPIEKYKTQIKRILTKLGIFDVLFAGIEKELSEWHVQDFTKEALFSLMAERFNIVRYETIWYMHQLLVLEPKKL